MSVPIKIGDEYGVRDCILWVVGQIGEKFPMHTERWLGEVEGDENTNDKNSDEKCKTLFHPFSPSHLSMGD